MFGHMARMNAERQRARNLPEREVTWDEYLTLAKEAGMDRPDFYGRISVGLGGALVVGDVKLKIIGPVPEKCSD